jgi:hypothetical protein
MMEGPMEILSALGGAMTGLFLTVMLTGMLAGIVAFGILDLYQRGHVQRIATARFFAPDPRKSLSEFLPDFVGIDERYFWRLPYRQLCGQLAGHVSLELRNDESSEREAFLTEYLAEHNERRREHVRQTFNDRQTSSVRGANKAAQRALQTIDGLQVVLAEEVQQAAGKLVAWFVYLTFAAICIPLAIFIGPSWQAFSVNAALSALLLAGMIAVALAFAATIVGSLTFKWVDRYASSR